MNLNDIDLEKYPELMKILNGDLFEVAMMVAKSKDNSNLSSEEHDNLLKRERELFPKIKDLRKEKEHILYILKKPIIDDKDYIRNINSEKRLEYVDSILNEYDSIPNIIKLENERNRYNEEETKKIEEENRKKCEPLLERINPVLEFECADSAILGDYREWKKCIKEAKRADLYQMYIDAKETLKANMENYKFEYDFLSEQVALVDKIESLKEVLSKDDLSLVTLDEFVKKVEEEKKEDIVKVLPIEVQDTKIDTQDNIISDESTIENEEVEVESENETEIEVETEEEIEVESENETEIEVETEEKSETEVDVSEDNLTIDNSVVEIPANEVVVVTLDDEDKENIDFILNAQHQENMVNNEASIIDEAIDEVDESDVEEVSIPEVVEVIPSEVESTLTAKEENERARELFVANYSDLLKPEPKKPVRSIVQKKFKNTWNAVKNGSKKFFAALKDALVIDDKYYTDENDDIYKNIRK